MIDWNTLIQTNADSETLEINAKSRARPTTHDDVLEKVGQPKPNEHNGLDDSARLARLARPKNKGVGVEQENNPHVEGVASDNFRDAKTYSVNPIAICLLLSCCNKATASGEEIFEQIMKLQAVPQPEQIRAWAMTCQKYGIDPYRIIHPFTESHNNGTSCQGCKHISMQKILTDKRPVFRFVCGQNHHMLEAFYVGERVLIAPESCNDYQPTT